MQAQYEEAGARLRVDSFLLCLATTDLRWLVIIDDLVDTHALEGMWPPSRPNGTVLVTTRDWNTVADGSDTAVIEVGPFSPDEARAYLLSQVSGTPEQADQVGRDLEFQPLALDHEFGVSDGGKLRVGYQAMAGAGLYQTRLASISRAERQLHGFSPVTVIGTNDPDFPTWFEIAFTAKGFGPPDEAVRPLDPPLRDEHAVRIRLSPDYPITFPTIEWLTPIFHPNVVDGRVCLRLRRPDLDTVCQDLIDLASYQIYDVRPEDFGGAGFLDLAAAAWVLSTDGQKKITARGGRPWFRAPRLRIPLDIQATDDTAVASPLPITVTLNVEMPQFSELSETGGFLLGHVFPTKDRYVVEIAEVMTPKTASGTRTTWMLTEESFRELRQRIGDRQLVGWFHTHPSDASNTLSAADRALHSMFFRQPWQVAMVVHRGRASFHAAGCLGFEAVAAQKERNEYR